MTQQRRAEIRARNNRYHSITTPPKPLSHRIGDTIDAAAVLSLIPQPRKDPDMGKKPGSLAEWLALPDDDLKKVIDTLTAELKARKTRGADELLAFLREHYPRPRPFNTSVIADHCEIAGVTYTKSLFETLERRGDVQRRGDRQNNVSYQLTT